MPPPPESKKVDSLEKAESKKKDSLEKAESKEDSLEKAESKMEDSLEKAESKKEDSLEKARKGINFLTAAILMVSYNAGLGLLALPHALSGTGWFGLILIGWVAMNSFYSSVLLGKTWLIMEERWEEYRGRFRYPYPAMGMRAIGNWMRYVVTASLHLSAFGTNVAYLLISAQIFQCLTHQFIHIHYKHWILLLGALNFPLTFFGSIEKFQFAGQGAMITIMIASVGILVNIILDSVKAKQAKFNPPTPASISKSFGTMMFGFGSIFFFVTVQNDMKHKEQYPKSATISFIALLLVYLPVAVAGYKVFGSSLDPNVLLSVTPGFLRKFIEVCLAIHVFLAMLLGINPVLQEIEEALNVPKEFNWKRCVNRTLIMFLVVAVAYSIPHFHKVMNLVGGSTMTMLTFIFPSLFYYMLKEEVSILKTIVLLQIIAMGILGVIACTYFSTVDVIETLKKNIPDKRAC